MTPLVLCAFDGVLVDLDFDIGAARLRIAPLFATERFPGEEISLLVWIDTACAALAEQDAARAGELRQRALTILDEEELRSADRCCLRPGARSFLDRVVGVPCVLLSNMHRTAVERALAHVGVDAARFDRILGRAVGSTTASSIASSSTLLLQMLDENWPQQIDRAVLIGGHPEDMQCAQQVSRVLAERGDKLAVVAVGLPKEPSAVAKFDEAGAWFIAADLEEATDLALAPRSPLALSLVYLAYNEQASIALAIEDARRFGRTYLQDYEVVIVDDGSTDATAAIAAGEATHGDVHVVRHSQNRGMGAGMRSGYQTASKNYIVHLPADRQVRAQSLLPFLAQASPDCIVISQYLEAPSGKEREILSLAFRFLVTKVGGLKVDYSGTYLFSRNWLERVPPSSVHSETFLFSFEILQRFAEQGARFASVAVRPFARFDGVSREVALHRILRVAQEIVRYRLRRIRASMARG